MWRQLATLRQGRWWFFWNFVVRGKAIRVSVWAAQPSKLKIDAVKATLEVK